MGEIPKRIFGGIRTETIRIISEEEKCEEIKRISWIHT